MEDDNIAVYNDSYFINLFKEQNKDIKIDYIDNNRSATIKEYLKEIWNRDDKFNGKSDSKNKSRI